MVSTKYEAKTCECHVTCLYLFLLLSFVLLFCFLQYRYLTVSLELKFYVETGSKNEFLLSKANANGLKLKKKQFILIITVSKFVFVCLADFVTRDIRKKEKPVYLRST